MAAVRARESAAGRHRAEVDNRARREWDVASGKVEHRRWRSGSLQDDGNASGLFSFLKKLIPAGKCFFAITMIVFGYSHFVYPEFVATLVPNWIPGHLFWTYFAGVALMLSGLAILLSK